MITRISLSLLALAALIALLGYPLAAVSLTALALALLELTWWRAHPHFERSFAARWRWSMRFYAEVHSDPWNRLLHIAGIPFVWLGCVGLFFCAPQGSLWWTAALAFVFGWALNGVGHALFEPDSGAYEAGQVDPLSVLTSVVWDLSQARQTLGECGRRLRSSAGQASPSARPEPLTRGG